SDNATSFVGCCFRSRRSMSLATQDLSPLLEGQGDYLAVGVALEVDLGADALGDKDILINGCDFERPLVGTLDEELGAGREDAQRKGGRKRIVAVVLLELGFSRRPFGRDRRGRADALGLERSAKLKPGEGVCAVGFALRPQQRVELERKEIARAVVAHFEFWLA